LDQKNRGTKEAIMKTVRKIVEIDENKCDGCGLCVPSCAEGAIRIVDGKAKIKSENFCDGLGACLGECPRGALRIVEREAEAFDEEAVKKEQSAPRGHRHAGPELPCGCPSTHLKTWTPSGSCEEANRPAVQDPSPSASELRHWPVQIRLVPPTAPFLKGAHLLVAADCTPVAYPRFHEDFLKGKTVLIGCPKFDDAEMYAQKFAQIFEKADLRSVTVVVMEVPCCQGLPAIVRKGMETAGKKVRLEKVVVAADGEILSRELLSRG
jgi:ferredoxin